MVMQRCVTIDESGVKQQNECRNTHALHSVHYETVVVDLTKSPFIQMRGHKGYSYIRRIPREYRKGIDQRRLISW